MLEVVLSLHIVVLHGIGKASQQAQHKSKKSKRATWSDKYEHMGCEEPQAVLY